MLYILYTVLNFILQIHGLYMHDYILCNGEERGFT